MEMALELDVEVVTTKDAEEAINSGFGTWDGIRDSGFGVRRGRSGLGARDSGFAENPEPERAPLCETPSPEPQNPEREKRSQTKPLDLTHLFAIR